MSKKAVPNLVCADEQGEIFEDPDLMMLSRQGRQMAVPRPGEIIPLPESSDLFLLPGRKALGLDPESGKVKVVDALAVAGFASPGHTLSGTAAYALEEGAPVLPLYAYGAVGYRDGLFWISAKLVDEDKRQVFTQDQLASIPGRAKALLRKYPDNRLIRHLTGCALNYCCPAARNLMLGRSEAPLPVSTSCNARCVGCISLQPPGSGFNSTQQRITFAPSAREIAEVMEHHGHKVKKAILSFGQGCEGEPLTRAEEICRAVSKVRKSIPLATVNMNTNASLPETIADLAGAGLDSVRVSLNSADPDFYHAYYRPVGYGFDQVEEFAARAARQGWFVSLNLLYFPGVTDTEQQISRLSGFLTRTGAHLIQLRNLNLDPDRYLELLPEKDLGPGTGLSNFMARISREHQGIRFGYFNPFTK